jgi:hypothetical protein
VPKEMTGYACSEVERRRCASILRLLLEAQTVQNLSLKESDGDSEAGRDACVKSEGESAAPSRDNEDA